MNAFTPSLTWATTAGAVYQVMYKNNLTDPAWTAAGPQITGTGATTTWSDTAASNATQRFYVLVQIQ
jgi:hypothetical protein